MELHQWHDVDWRGRVERAEYSAYDNEGKLTGKYASVYLPYGYDAAKKYNVLYIMHGGGGNPDAWLDASPIKNALDQAFNDGRCEPFITVFPTYYYEAPSVSRARGIGMEAGRDQVLFFQKELRERLIPAIESRYSTYAETVDEKGLRSSRDHRAFSGFSMGGCTTWFAFTRNLDLIRTFLPLSGDSWEVKQMGGREAPGETAKLLAEAVADQGFTKADFNILCGTGSTDIAYPQLCPQIEAMKELDMFEYSDDPKKGNLHYAVMDGAPHDYNCVYQHIYNFLPYIFA